MIKLILAGAIVFAVAMGGATGFVIWRTPAPAALDSTAHDAGADSTALGTGAAHPTTPAVDSGPAPTAVADSHSAPAVSGPAAADPGSVHAVAPTPTVTPPMPRLTAIVQPTQADSQKALQQLARIFTSMKPAEAAKIMAFLSDSQVEGLLRQLGVRQAAQLLTELPTERAAVLSRRLLDTQTVGAR